LRNLHRKDNKSNWTALVAPQPPSVNSVQVPGSLKIVSTTKFRVYARNENGFGEEALVSGSNLPEEKSQAGFVVAVLVAILVLVVILVAFVFYSNLLFHIRLVSIYMIFNLSREEKKINRQKRPPCFCQPSLQPKCGDL